MSLTIIAAVSDNNVIGKENRVPWRIKEDMKRFRDLTLGHTVIMGRRTYESIPQKFRPLPQRRNIVLSGTIEPSEGIYVARNIEEALKLAQDQEAYVIGGGKVYESFLPLAKGIELTRIHQYFSGDTFFPEVDWSNWDLVCEERNIEDGISYSFLTYSRIKNSSA